MDHWRKRAIKGMSSFTPGCDESIDFLCMAGGRGHYCPPVDVTGVGGADSSRGQPAGVSHFSRTLPFDLDRGVVGVSGLSLVRSGVGSRFCSWLSDRDLTSRVCASGGTVCSRHPPLCPCPGTSPADNGDYLGRDGLCRGPRLVLAGFVQPAPDLGSLLSNAGRNRGLPPDSLPLGAMGNRPVGAQLQHVAAASALGSSPLLLTVWARPDGEPARGTEHAAAGFR